MSTTPPELLATASRIAALDQPTEADVRAVISRAYYAALHSAAATFPGEDLAHNGSSHEAIIDRAETFGRSLNPGRTEASQAARELKKFKRLRKTADYRLAIALPLEEGARAIALGAAILKFCEMIQVKQAQAAT